MTSHNMKGRPCCDRPMEQHVFTGADFLCSVCGRPRALHLKDGFTPAPSVLTDWKVLKGYSLRRFESRESGF